MTKILFATHNENKVKEVRELLPKWEIHTLNDIGYATEIPETGNSFRENAQLKVAALTSVWSGAIVSDDSGLMVDALDGAPGVYSKRYAGTGLAADNNTKLLADLQGIPDRSAAFVAVFCLKLDGDFTFFEGKVNGKIADKPLGEKGFGYDPIFIPEGYAKSFAQLGAEVKNQISHRARAVQKLIEFMDNR